VNTGKPPRLWTQEEETELTRMAGEGRPLREIAIVLGRTREAVTSRATKLRVKVRDWRETLCAAEAWSVEGQGAVVGEQRPKLSVAKIPAAYSNLLSDEQLRLCIITAQLFPSAV